MVKYVKNQSISLKHSNQYTYLLSYSSMRDNLRHCNDMEKVYEAFSLGIRIVISVSLRILSKAFLFSSINEDHHGACLCKRPSVSMRGWTVSCSALAHSPPLP